jgi:hypothetical protein
LARAPIPQTFGQAPGNLGSRNITSASRRLPAALAFILAIACGAASFGDDVSRQLDDAISGGLDFLAKAQNPDGSFDGGGPKLAVTGLALMSMLASGNTPDEGKYGLTVRAAEDYLIKQTPEDGYFGTVDGSRMYGQGIITLALAEASGVEPDVGRRTAMRGVLARAVKIILDAQDIQKDQNFAGGWRYEPQSNDSDLSLSGWNALALRAAESVGLSVPKDRAQRAAAFVLKCYKPDEHGFSYQPGAGASIAMTGVGVLNLFLLDAADRPEAADGARWLMAHPVGDDTRMPYYSMYYATQAAYQAGGDVWPAVWASIQAKLLPTQNKSDGGWPQSHSGEEPGRVYATSMAILTMSVPYRLLPVYQR